MFFGRRKTFICQQKVGLIFLSLGVSFFALFFVGKQSNHLYFSKVPELKAEDLKEDLPRRIIISVVGIELPVFPARVSVDRWEISENGASYLLGSGSLGKPGNVVIYGHNKENIFGKIRLLKKGAEIKIESIREKNFFYKVTEVKIVSPKDIAVLRTTEDRTLTLYTCTGNFDLQRFVVIAKKI